MTSKQKAINELEMQHIYGNLSWTESQRRIAMVQRATNKARLQAIVERGV